MKNDDLKTEIMTIVFISLTWAVWLFGVAVALYIPYQILKAIFS